jgi:hypothetical protein
MGRCNNKTGQKKQPLKYTNLKIRARRDIASSFAGCCERAGVDADEELSRFMASCCGLRLDLDMPLLMQTCTRKDRGKAAECLILCLEKLIMAEQDCLDRADDGPCGTEDCLYAADSIEYINDAIQLLAIAY